MRESEKEKRIQKPRIYDDETLEKMKKGTAANFIVYEAPGLGVPMKISLEGFSAGLESLNTL